MSKQPPRVFAREATGLVREVGFLETVALNLSSIDFGLGILVMLSTLSLFPGGDPVIGALLSALIFVPLGIIYAMTLSALPRSGGDYVFVSRALHQAFGVVVAWTILLWSSFFDGVAANYVFTLGLGPTFSIIGSIEQNSTISDLVSMITSTSVVIGGGILLLVAIGLIATFFPRSLFRLLSIFLYSGVLSLLLMAAILLISNHADFVSRFNAYSASFGGTSDYYSKLVSAASVPSAGFSWSQTINLLPVGAYTFLFISAQQTLGGEIKNAQRVTYKAMLATLLVSGLLTAGMIYLVERVIGYDFLYAAGALAGSPSYVLPVLPSYNFLIGILTQNTVILAVTQLLFLGWYLVIPLLALLVVTRTLLASSMDRVSPSIFARVSDRFHTPYIVTWIVVILGCLSLVVYTQYASILANLSATLGDLLGVFLLVSIGAILFPFSHRTKRLYESSPIQFRVIGIPVITLLGILSTLVLLALTYMYATNNAYGTNSPFSVAAVAFQFVSAFLIFGGSYLYHKRKGLDLMLAFAEIPPE